jgi:hypothetical protein
MDALAVMDWYRSHRAAAPSILVSGGAGVRAFLDQPHVQTLLKQAATVYLSLENEKSQETQIKTDAAHQRQIEKIQALGCNVVAWRPPFGSKDICDAWKAGALPDAHHPMAHTRQESKGSDDAKLTPTPAVCQPSTPTP